ncbi:MAG: M48 family metalloprotease, partial [Humidesulfovibrio sp.]|nr:M48 family metalloprotease [Humidesulfovibrio sp.]
ACLTVVCLLALATPALVTSAMAAQAQAAQAYRPAHKTTLWIATDRTPLRSERSGVAVVLKELPLGMPVRLLRCEGVWLLILEPGGAQGWTYQGHLDAMPPAPTEIGLFAPLPGSIVLAEAAETSRSSRSVQPVRNQDTQSLWTVLELPFTRQHLEDFLREGGIGEYARVSPQSSGRLPRLPALKAATAPGGDAERLLGLNLAVAAVRQVAKPAFGIELQRYVNMVGLSVARYAPGNAQAYRFVVLESQEPLSFSLPGGFVMLSTGLLKALDNEAQLACVLARESAKASLGHAWARAKRSLFFRSSGTMTDAGVQSPLFAPMLKEMLESALRQGLGRGQESGAHADMREVYEADAAAIQMAYRAGYDPLQLAAAIRNVESAAELAGIQRTSVTPGEAAGKAGQSGLRPAAQRRIEHIQALLAQLPMQDGLALGTQRFHANR